MKVVLITQDEPFFLAENIRFLLGAMPEGVEVVGCVLSAPSPFGRKESFLRKGLKTLRIFGIDFFLRYLLRFLRVILLKEPRVKNVLDDAGVQVIELDESINANKSIDRIKALAPDLLISIAGNEIFKRPLIDLAPLGCLNLHTALLPKYRGLMPSFWVLRFGEDETGVSVFFVDEGIDSGPIIIQRKVPISGMSQQELIRKTKRIGMECVIEALIKIKEGNVETLPNEDEKQTYFGFPSREDVISFRRAGAKFF